MKTEKQKMLDGELYDCADPELTARWHVAKNLTRDYNQLDAGDKDGMDRILSKLLGSRGKHLTIAAPFYVDYGENIHFGEHCEVNMNCVFLDCNTITIGDHSGMGPAVQIYTVGHPVKAEERLSPKKEGSFSYWKGITAPVIIGKNVWIGGGSIILPGVIIGDNTTIGAGSVVTKSIPANCLAVGNPCKVVKYL